METIKAGHMEARLTCYTHVRTLSEAGTETEMSDNLGKKKEESSHVVGRLTVSSPAVSHVSLSQVRSMPGGRARRSFTILSIICKYTKIIIKKKSKNIVRRSIVLSAPKQNVHDSLKWGMEQMFPTYCRIMFRSV